MMSVLYLAVVVICFASVLVAIFPQFRVAVISLVAAVIVIVVLVVLVLVAFEV